MGIKLIHHKEASGLQISTTSNIVVENIIESSLTAQWLNSEEAANILRISVKALRNMTSNGRIPFYKLGRRNRYRKDDLDKLLLSQKRGK